MAKDELLELPMWEGDRAFVRNCLRGAEDISMTLQYTGENCKITEENEYEETI